MRLRTKIIASFCALMVAGGAVTTLVVSRGLSRSLTAAAREHGEAIGAMLGRQLALPLLATDNSEVAQLFSAAVSVGNGTQYVFLAGEDHEIRAKAVAPGHATGRFEELAAKSVVSTVRIGDDSLLDIPVAVQGPLGPRLGTVHVGISLASVERAVTGVTRWVMAITAAAMLVGILLVVVLAGLVTRPIKRLAEVTRRMGEGDLDAVATVGGRDELADLAKTFNEMAAQIRARVTHSEDLRKYFELVLDHVPAGVIVCRDDARIEYANKVVRDATGRPDGFPCPEDIKACPCRCEQCPAPNLLGKEGSSLRQYTTEAGRTFEMRTVPIASNGQGRSLVITMLDITETRRLAKRLHRAERLAVAGEVAAGIVHAINNPLDGVRRALGLARKGAAESERMATLLDIATEGTDRIANITRTLLSFARADEAQAPMRVSPNLIVEEAVRLVQLRAEGSGVHLRLDLAPDVPDVILDPVGINEVVVNLLLNALDATSLGGEVTVRSTYGGNGSIDLSVTDSGSGIPPELVERLFEPFFTTKEVGRGTGLGLSVARRIVEAHGGDISVESRPGSGSTFRVRLPIIQSNTKRREAA